MRDREVSTRLRLRVVGSDGTPDGNETADGRGADQGEVGSLHPVVHPPVRPRLGVLSLHLDGQPCRVGCPFCYLGARVESGAGAGLDGALIEAALGRLDYDEVAVAVSEPASAWLERLGAIVRAAGARGRPVALTTTPAVVLGTPAVVDGVGRVSLSIDPQKGAVTPQVVRRAARAARGPGREVVLIVSLISPEFADQVIDGLLAEYLEIAEVDRVALNALKPPPPWCGRRFWLQACARLGPLLARHLGRRLFLDCWVGARILGIGPCPARPDLSPAGAGAAFRSCVYQAAPDFEAASVDELEARLAGFAAPPVCPFVIPE